MTTKSKTRRADGLSRRISISLSGRAADTVRRLSTDMGIPEGDVVRRAVGLLETMVEEEAQGGAMVIRDASGDVHSVRFLPAY